MVIVPKRPKPKPKPVIVYPPVPQKKWIPPYLRPKPPVVKITDLIAYPTLVLKKWIPPYKRPRKKPRRPEITLPPLETKKWIPPYKRPRKKPKIIMVKPIHKVNMPLKRSSLPKWWKKFLKLDKDVWVLFGDYSQAHKRFRFTVNDKQSACCCTIAIVMSQITEMREWSSETVDKVLIIGTDLYYQSRKNLANSFAIMKPSDVNTFFYVEDLQITICTTGDRITGKLMPEYENDTTSLVHVLPNMFETQKQGIFWCQEKCFAIWMSGETYYAFDPTDHDWKAMPFDGIRGEGLAVVMRFAHTDALLLWLLDNLDQCVNSEFKIYPCVLLKMSKFHKVPPESFEVVMKPPEKECNATSSDTKLAQILVSRATSRVTSIQEVVEEEEAPIAEVLPSFEMLTAEDRAEMLATDEEEMFAGTGEEEDGVVALPKFDNVDPILVTEEFSPEVPSSANVSWMEGIPFEKLDEMPDSRIPKEKPRVASISYFRNMDTKMGILRASMHQGDPKFQHWAGKQSFANAIASIAMLRIYKSRMWHSKILDDILIVGQVFHNDTMTELLPSGKSLRPCHMHNKITVATREFNPVVEEATIIGRLNSEILEILDLVEALENFFREYDAGILWGPITVGVWLEDGLYYMFDPQERDKLGIALPDPKFIPVDIDIPVGYACVTWFERIKDLVELYMMNVDRENRYDAFSLNRVEITDYVEIQKNWFCYKALTTGKWILQGTYSQRDRRFEKEFKNTQCTSMAVIALIKLALKDPKEWNCEEIDNILDEGDKLHQYNIGILKEKNAFKEPQLLITEVARKFRVYEKEFHLIIEDCVINGTVGDKSESELIDMTHGFAKYFEENDSGIFTARDTSLAFWKLDDGYFYFDSHSCDDAGFVDDFGYACSLRFDTLEDMVRMIQGNLKAGLEDLYNINKVSICIWDITAEGILKPPLYNFVEASPYVSILRSIYSVYSDIFRPDKGRQPIPTCLVCLGMKTLYPPNIWCQNIIDDVMEIGMELYKTTMKKLTIESERRDEDPPEEITSENVVKEYYIGINKFTLEIGDTLEGNFEENFIDHMADIFPMEETISEEPRIDHYLVENDSLKFIMWRDEDFFYIFDPMPRDNAGCVYGKDTWSAKYIPEPEDEEEGGEYSDWEGGGFDREIGAGDAPADELNPSRSQRLDEDRRSAGSQTTEDEEERKAKAERLAKAEEERKKKEEEKRLEEERKLEEKRILEEALKVKELAEGTACLLRFTDIEFLKRHIMENTPPNRRIDMPYKLSAITFENKPQKKRIFDPELEPRHDVYAGDWYEFLELDYGRWILRGTMDQTHYIFPEANRGKQSIPNCYVALAYGQVFALSQCKPSSVDYILKQGDRLFSYTKRLYIKELKESKELIKLDDDQITALVDGRKYSIKDISRYFCVAEHRIRIGITINLLMGDITSNNTGGVMNLYRGLDVFFRSNKSGILCCKDLIVAIWKGETVYYMFDPNARGPNGVKYTNGTACITRFLNPRDLINVFLESLPKEGSNLYFIHKVRIEASQCCRDRQPEDIPMPPPPKMSAYNQIVPGKCILRGNFSQDDPRFGRGRNVQCAPIAITALTMTLIHKCQKWTKPIVDEIVTLGDELYLTALDKVGYDFNPWEEGMTVDLVPRDYKIGILKANCELRNNDQRGIIDIRHPKILNIRQGIDRFFEENTHGVLESETLTVALWEEDDGPNTYIYMFDPNPRGPTGLPSASGTACVVTFANAAVCAAHIIDLIPAEKRQGEYMITPVEIIVGKHSLPCKKETTRKPSKKVVNEMERFENKKACAAAKRARKLAEEQRRRKEAEMIERIGREDYFELPNGDWIIRGTRSQASSCYTETSRGNQDIPNCIAAYVMHCMMPISSWSYKTIDAILDTGEQIYIDSYITYNPKDPRLGLTNVLRKFCVKNVQVQVIIYKPLIEDLFLLTNVEIALANYFQQETFCLIGALNKWLAVFFKGGYYYVFDPHDRNHEGNRTPYSCGCAVAIKCPTMHNCATRIVTSLICQSEQYIGKFQLVLVSIKEIKMTDGQRSILRKSLSLT